MPLFLNATHTVFTTTDLALRYSALGFMKNVIDVIEERKMIRTVTGSMLLSWVVCFLLYVKLSNHVMR